MLIKNVIAYLEDQSIKASSRFKVLTGFDTQVSNKDRDNSYWFNALYQSKIIENLQKAKATASFGGFFSSFAAAVSGTDLESQLKAAYKKGSLSSDEQTEGQEEYIGIIVAYLKENQTAESLSKFEFVDPVKLLNKSVEPATSHSYS